MNKPLGVTLYFLLMRMRIGGTIVSGSDCTAAELAQARVEGRIYIDRDGFALVYRPPVVAREKPNR